MDRRKMRAALAAVGTAALLALTACGGGGAASPPQRRCSAAARAAEPTKIKLQLQWVAQAQFAGYYAADDQGYYTDEGLDVEIVEGGAGHRAAGRALGRRRRLRDLLGAQGARLDREGRQDHRRRPDLRAQRAPPRSRSRTRASPRRPSSPARRSAAGASATSGSCSPECRRAGSTSADVKLVKQAFDMNGFLSGDIDAAQAMTYNEYAQVLESKNPKTGELYQARGPERRSTGTTSGPPCCRTRSGPTPRSSSDPAYQDQTTKFIKASIKGWVYARDNPEEAAKIVTAAGSQLGESHQLWMTNEVNKLIWPSTAGVGMITTRPGSRPSTSPWAPRTRPARRSSPRQPPETANSNTYVEKALGRAQGRRRRRRRQRLQAASPSS